MSRPSLADILRNAEENAAIAEAYREHGYTMKGTANHLGVHYGSVTKKTQAQANRICRFLVLNDKA